MQRSFLRYAASLGVLDLDVHSKYLAVTLRSPLARSGIPNVAVNTGFQAHFGGPTLEIKMHITQQILLAGTFPVNHRDQRHILHKMSLSAISKISTLQKIFMRSPFC